MTRRTDFQKANTYTGQKLKGPVDISYKIDGVRILYRDGKLVTRNNKVPPGLYNALTMAALEKCQKHLDVEVYAGDFFASNSPLQQHNPEFDCIDEGMIYPLVSGTDHGVDRRLHIGTYDSPSEDLIKGVLKIALGFGYEGLILRNKSRWYRVKPHYTADVRITGFFEQLDKNKKPKGQLGGFDTNYGKVTAFTEEDRVALWDNPGQHIGKLMEVVYRELYDTGSFRYCVKFVRFRDDKDEETFDTKNYEVM